MPTGTTPRKIARKLRPPAWYTLKQEQAKVLLQQPERMRTKYNKPRTKELWMVPLHATFRAAHAAMSLRQGWPTINAFLTRKAHIGRRASIVPDAFAPLKPRLD